MHVLKFSLFLNTANPAYQHIQNQQQYTPNFQHQHPPQSHYNGSNQFEQQQPHVPQNQQNNTNFIHSVSSSSSQQQPPIRGDEFLSASVVRRHKKPTPNVGKLNITCHRQECEIYTKCGKGLSHSLH